MTVLRSWRQAIAAGAVVLVAALTGCGAPTNDAPGQRSTAARGQESTASRPSGSPPTGSLPSSNPRRGPDATDDDQEAVMRIRIQVGEETFTATIDDTPAGRDLIAQLPQTIEMTDHGGVEKTGPLRSPLSLDGGPAGADPDVGDVGYYAPGNDLVLYYGDQAYFAGIVVLGRLDDRAPARLGQMDGAVTVTVTDAS